MHAVRVLTVPVKHPRPVGLKTDPRTARSWPRWALLKRAGSCVLAAEGRPTSAGRPSARVAYVRHRERAQTLGASPAMAHQLLSLSHLTVGFPLGDPQLFQNGRSPELRAPGRPIRCTTPTRFVLGFDCEFSSYSLVTSSAGAPRLGFRKLKDRGSGTKRSASLLKR
ncbi:MAG: hypothetical protein JWQ73_1475 [Variovorax sp.]|nr:hypothetical protein [Variovorax sp.]